MSEHCFGIKPERLGGNGTRKCGAVLWRCKKCGAVGCLIDGCTQQKFHNGRCMKCGHCSKEIVK